MPEDGAAQVVFTGLDARWLLWSFRDLSVSVVVRHTGTQQTGLYYARAFNTSRFVEFFERRWFRLPYARRDVQVALDGGSGSMRLADGDLVAEMAPREPGAWEERTFVVPLHLPGRRRLTVRVSGRTATFRYDAARDRFAVAAACTDAVLAGLRASGFRGVEWHVRPSATHARTRTFRSPPGPNGR